MKTLVATLFILILMTTAHAASLKIEGTCTGKNADGRKVTYIYYSDFDGCRQVSKAAIAFAPGPERLYTGKRTFTDSLDIYNFKDYRLTFANSTGNLTGKLTTLKGKIRKTVTLNCDVRDYEYGECSH